MFPNVFQSSPSLKQIRSDLKDKNGKFRWAGIKPYFLDIATSETHTERTREVRIQVALFDYMAKKKLQRNECTEIGRSSIIHKVADTMFQGECWQEIRENKGPVKPLFEMCTSKNQTPPHIKYREMWHLNQILLTDPGADPVVG